MDFILEKVREAPPEQRATEAERLLKCFDCPERWEIPRGRRKITKGRYDVEDIRASLNDDEQFFLELAQVFGSSPPAVFTSCYERFKRNSEQSLRLAAMDENDRQRLPEHEFFPHFDGLNEMLHGSRYNGIFKIPTDDVTFTTELLGRGTFACVYKAHSARGTPLALKLFRTTFPPKILDELWEHVLYKIKENIISHIDDLSEKPFLAPLIIPDHAHWYVMEFGRGETVESRMRREHIDHETAGRILLTYGQMLKQLHAKQMCFVDNQWRSVLVCDDDVRVCDYDLVSSVEDLNHHSVTKEFLFGPEKEEVEHRHFARFVHTLCYSCREVYVRDAPRNHSSDLESFALMADRLIIGDHFIGADGEHWTEGMRKEAEQRKAAEENQRAYAKHRAAKLPKHLRQIIPGLIQYPRDDSITAADFVAAIKLDYGT